MAENNSSAPLKTALPTNVEAFEHFVSDCDGAGIQYDGPSYEQGFLSGKVVGMDAAQAVAAQAAPASVAVPDERWCPDVCPITGREFFMWVTHHESGDDVPTYGGPFDSYTIPTQDKDGSFSCERYDHDFGGWKDWENVGLMLVDDQSFVVAPDNPRYYEIEQFATPALPATEDSSAGDLAESAHAAALAHACELLSTTIGILMGRREKIAYTDRSPIAAAVNEAVEFLRTWPSKLPQAEVQAEPVGGQCRWKGEKSWSLCTAEHVRMALKDPRYAAEGYEVRYLYTAPQAQPADALDAARYRYLRDGWTYHYQHESREKLDASLDAAMAAAQEGGNAAKEA